MILQGYPYAYGSKKSRIKMLAMENTAQPMVRVCQVIENPPGVMTLAPAIRVHASLLVPLPLAYHGGKA